jgi:hypothetical protein
MYYMRFGTKTMGKGLLRIEINFLRSGITKKFYNLTLEGGEAFS